MVSSKHLPHHVHLAANSEIRHASQIPTRRLSHDDCHGITNLTSRLVFTLTKLPSYFRWDYLWRIHLQRIMAWGTRMLLLKTCMRFRRYQWSNVALLVVSNGVQAYYSADLLYILATCCVKVSLIAFYNNLAVDEVQKRIIMSVGAFCLATTIGMLFTAVFQCGAGGTVWEVMTLHCFNQVCLHCSKFQCLSSKH